MMTIANEEATYSSNRTESDLEGGPRVIASIPPKVSLFIHAAFSAQFAVSTRINIRGSLNEILKHVSTAARTDDLIFILSILLRFESS